MAFCAVAPVQAVADERSRFIMAPAEIRRALQEKGVALTYTSIRHALGQLEAREAARQVGNSRTWRYSAG
jgi:hypothetical protein